MKIDINLTKIRNKIGAVEKQFGRKNNSVCLIAVSKTRKINEIIQAIDKNQRHFGENYCQEAVEKIKTINRPDIIWHFIGPIQSNKTKQIAHYFNWVHTLDRLKIAQRLNEMRPDDLPPLNICVQVNTSNEVTKSGLSIDKLESFIDDLKEFKRLKVRGLMSLPEIKRDFDEQRESFKELNKVFLRLNKNNAEIDVLSMGTSNDMEAAIAEGATFVRIGTAIFGPRIQ